MFGPTKNETRDFMLENGLSSPVTSTTESPDASSTGSDSPTPASIIREKKWSSHYQSIGACEDQRQLLGTEEESSDRLSSDGDVEEEEDVWTITEELHCYYEKQFNLLQTSGKGVVGAKEARRYFEKSRLSVIELQRIWELADVPKDGVLSLSEFKVAMHLIVSRYHDFPLPSSLPETLVSSAQLHIDPSSNVYNKEDCTSTSPLLQGKEWTKFADSPPSTVSSPGPKPVNFDFPPASVEMNPKIVHPVPMRATPGSTMSDQLSDDLVKSQQTELQGSVDQTHIKAIQRPQGKKSALVPVGAVAIPPPPVQPSASDDVSSTPVNSNGLSGPASLPVGASKKEPPPPPPPRPNRTHFRSSSLDLNNLGKYNGAPYIPPRISPGVNFGLRPQDCNAQGHTCVVDFSKHHGAFHAYKKSNCKDAFESNFTDKTYIPTKATIEEGNKYLRCFCKELQDELNALREEKRQLQNKLEELHSIMSCSSTS